MKTVLKKVKTYVKNRQLKPYYNLVSRINECETTMQALSDDALKNQTEVFRQTVADGACLDEIMVPAFATVREVAVRVLNMRHFDVQLVGGMILHAGCISEMKTGEGKTLVATLPAYLNALSGQGVYIVTVNDYLAKRDCQWMAPVFSFLGLTVGLIQADMTPEDRLKAYSCDITYGTNNEFGFDYLRDHLAPTREECCQVRRHFAIIDEVDSILIDEARTPLIISGPIQDSTSSYLKVVKAIRVLTAETDFTCDEKHKNVVLTDDGISKLEKRLSVSNLFSVQNMAYAHMAVQCLRAMHLFKKDVDYVVKEGQIIIVDEFTGRLMDGRRYSDGLHQAIEACEGLRIQKESQTMASITFQNYFRMFPKLSGMTGTAVTEADEFRTIYGLEVLDVPAHKPMVREDKSDVVYKDKANKYQAIVDGVKCFYDKGQPVLVGTISIEVSELLSQKLKKLGVVHHVLNAKHHDREAEIIAKAGQKGSVTIATNMAGRGTDIVLGPGVVDLGGLVIIGTERHESRRIDNQLRGRSGRQGDPGMSQFYVSLEDDLMRLFGSGRMSTMMGKLGMPDDMAIEHSLITRSIAKAQKKVEQYHFSVRKQVLQYDDVMTQQRTAIYGIRDTILSQAAVMDHIHAFIVYLLIKAGLKKDEAGVQSAIDTVVPLFNLSLNERTYSQISDADKRVKAVAEQCAKQVEKRFEGCPEAMVTDLGKLVMLQTLDRKWVDHLQNMEVLREGIGLRAWGQRDPLVEYKQEAFILFNDLLFDIRFETLDMLMRVTFKVESYKK